MLLAQKIQSVGGISDFLNVKTEEIPKKKKIGVGLATTGLIAGGMAASSFPLFPHAVPAMATMPMPILGFGSISTKIIHAFDPVVSLLQGLSFPICLIYLTCGFFVIAAGKKQQGIAMIKWACLGYLGIQFAPALMNILAEIGKAIGK